MRKLNNFFVSFAGKTNIEMHAELTDMPIRQHPVLNGEKKELANGGFAFWTNGKYKSITVKQGFAVPDNDYLPGVLNWLRGSGELIFGDDPTHAYDAMILTPASRKSPSKRLEGQEFEITFTCQPLKHLVNEQPIVLTSGSVFNGQGHENTMPLLKVEGSGSCTITINGRAMQVSLTSGTPLYIDSEFGTAYTMTNGVYDYSGGDVMLLADWPELLPYAATSDGYNNVNFTSGITKLTITPRWRWF